MMARLGLSEEDLEYVIYEEQEHVPEEDTRCPCNFSGPRRM